jgi:Ca-activated chloride channel family protein
MMFLGMRLGSMALCAAALLLPPQDPPPQAQAQTPHFSTHAEFVRVDTLVTSHGTSVKGLTAEDFEVRDNGVLQQVTVTDASTMPVDVALALDVSGSVNGLRMINLKRAARTLVESLRPGDRAALVSFNDMIFIESPLTDDFKQLEVKISALMSIGRTSLRDAAYVAMLQTDPDAGRGLVVVFTDGQDISSFMNDGTLVDTANRVNAVVYSVALTANKNSLWDVPQDAILDELPRVTGGRRFSAENPEKLRDVFAAILAEFRQRYILSYTPQGVDRAGYHALDVRLAKGRKGEVHARPGYVRG